MEEGGHPSEKHMDDYFKSIGLLRKKIAKDGSCLFRAVAEQVGDHTGTGLGSVNACNI